MSELNLNGGMCPICFKLFPIAGIEVHVNKCIFLNSSNNDDNCKKKRAPSPTLQIESAKSPRLSQSSNILPRFNFKSPNKRIVEPANSQDDSGKSPNKSGVTCNVNFTVPLAKQLAPKSLEQFFGQEHVLGANSILRQLLERGDIPNMILWGPPGCGKTSLANVLREMSKCNSKYKFVSLCAANTGVKEVQNIVSAGKLEQKFGRQTLIFMDEIHRFNKKQQDTFLVHVEKGDIILIGATTENPSFSINSALLSRCRVIVMEKLNSQDLLSILQRAAAELSLNVIDEDSFQEIKGICIEKATLSWLADISDGDARIALNNLQMVVQHNNSINKLISVQDVKDGIKKSHLLYDRKGEEHYNIISAMHKSIRGSDPDAALYWTTRMIVSGEDPLFIARRMVRAASEDIGNADPQALQLAVATMQGCQLLGMPEADVLLSQCAIYLARAPKSREADSALAAAKQAISKCRGIQPPVPMHLRNAPTKLMKELGYGKIAKNEKFSYMPPGMENVQFIN